MQTFLLGKTDCGIRSIGSEARIGGSFGYNLFSRRRSLMLLLGFSHDNLCWRGRFLLLLISGLRFAQICICKWSRILDKPGQF